MPNVSEDAKFLEYGIENVSWQHCHFSSEFPTNVEVGKNFFDSVLDRVLTNYQATNDG